MLVRGTFDGIQEPIAQTGRNRFFYGAPPDPVAPSTLDLSRVAGLAVGHAEDPEASSGVTAVLFDAAVPTVVEVRGGASATYDTASLSLDSTFGRRWALFFSAGASMAWTRREGFGFGS